MSDKHRLFINLYARLAENSGGRFHFALMLAPKNSGKDKNETRSAWIFESTNNALPDHQSEYVPWRYSRKSVSPTKSRRLIAKILVAKLPANQTIDEWADAIDAILCKVPIIQHDPSFNCRFWTRQAMIALANEGGPFSSIPKLLELGTGRLEEDIIKVGNEALEKYLEKGGNMTPIERDFRNRSDSPL